MNLDNAKIGDVLLSYGGADDKPLLKLLHGQIRAAQDKAGYREHDATHVQVKIFDSCTWASDEQEGVRLHAPKIYADRRYRLARCNQQLTPQGIAALQAYAVSQEGRKYDKGQLASIGIATVSWIPAFLRRWLARRFDGGGNYTVCSGLVYDALRAAGMVLPMPLLDPNRRNPGERAMPALFEPQNNPAYFWRVDVQ
jgi:hypothetical protein